jgi:hypothetical protein
MDSFQFGVCATASSDPHCTADPNAVPKAADVIAPSGVNQSDELDYTSTTQSCYRESPSPENGESVPRFRSRFGRCSSHELTYSASSVLHEGRPGLD